MNPALPPPRTMIFRTAFGMASRVSLPAWVSRRAAIDLSPWHEPWVLIQTQYNSPEGAAKSPQPTTPLAAKSSEQHKVAARFSPTFPLTATEQIPNIAAVGHHQINSIPFNPKDL